MYHFSFFIFHFSFFILPGLPTRGAENTDEFTVEVPDMGTFVDTAFVVLFTVKRDIGVVFLPDLENALRAAFRATRVAPRGATILASCQQQEYTDDQ